MRAEKQMTRHSKFSSTIILNILASGEFSLKVCIIEPLTDIYWKSELWGGWRLLTSSKKAKINESREVDHKNPLAREGSLVCRRFKTKTHRVYSHHVSTYRALNEPSTLRAKLFHRRQNHNRVVEAKNECSWCEIEEQIGGRKMEDKSLTFSQHMSISLTSSTHIVLLRSCERWYISWVTVREHYLIHDPDAKVAIGRSNYVFHLILMISSMPPA